MPTTQFSFAEKYRYQTGFDSYLESEAAPGSLPIGANSPQKPPHGLYAEKLSGTAFTAPRHENKQTWLYRILPSCSHPPFEAANVNAEAVSDFSKLKFIPNQLRWDPFDHNESKDLDFVAGLRLVAGAGDPALKQGLGMYIYAAGKSMDEHTAFYSADGDLLIVAQEGVLDIRTEFGWFEDHGTTASDGPTKYSVMVKFNNALFQTTQAHTPFDVVAWHGNYYPYKYDLGRFNTIGSISYDHPDPSIFTVLSAPSEHPGTAVADFVIFPPRWLVAEDTFRPPWYHRNTMSEFMGLILGAYDAKRAGKGGFVPGGASLHNVMSGHGPDAASYEGARNAELKPAKVGEGSCAFMFESCLMVGVTEWGLKTCQKVQEGYNDESWGGVRVHWQRPEGDHGKAHLL
ncbi:unnamed protein product [Parascedosporium putredinis]|uniref:homogentisate 1,2-dioxygenase n=1 Tax=Parascedosporium putredinis TaxID=1442378 RepID=A0A9P1MBL2_9PEZI|nr:unnamed protein product [Parascedosporium putredinis]CAI7996096.1 unnamed protein product [Parascedosporium putredinis]